MNFGLYIHLPFCRSKCPYCNFSSITGAEHLIERYIKACSIELNNRLTDNYGKLPKTIYIGGGTPSLIPFEHIHSLIRRFDIDSSVEFSVEANPDSITKFWLDGIRESGVNRLSIGIQSLDDKILGNLGRIHTACQAVDAVEIARTAGFSNISVDLMFGVPGQTMSVWEKTLEEVIELNPQHISCYSLSIEDDTEYFQKAKQGELILSGHVETADMYRCMAEKLESNGYAQYELSNFARTDCECRHNQAYWDFTPYLGIGAAAHSFDGTMRSWNTADPEVYIDRILSGKEQRDGNEHPDETVRAAEQIMLTLRTKKGLDTENITGLTHKNFEKLVNTLDSYVESGFMQYLNNGNIVLTGKGSIIADEIIAEVLTEI